MLIEAAERWLESWPIINGLYLARAARAKRNICLLLNRFGLLRPFTFVQWLATFACNCRCPFCEASAGQPAPDELATVEVKTLIDDLAAMGVKRLVISGGEPLVRPDLVEVMAHAHQKGLKLGLVSNGYLVPEMWPRLRRFDYFLFFTSLDGPPKVHDRLRGREGVTRGALRGLELFRQKGALLRIVNTVVHPDNLACLEELEALVASSAANRWHLSPALKVGRAAAGGIEPLKLSQLKRLVDFVRRPRKGLAIDLGESHRYLGSFCGGWLGKPFFCGAGLTRCSIMPSGEVMGCHQVYDPTLSEGNIRQRPFSDLWRQEFKRFRGRAFDEPCAGCEHLAACQGGCWAEWSLSGACLKGLWVEEA